MLPRGMGYGSLQSLKLESNPCDGQAAEYVINNEPDAAAVERMDVINAEAGELEGY